MANEVRLIVDALKKYHDSKFTPGVYEHSIFGKAALLLENDAAEVVRCKDCKYWVNGATYCEHESGLNDDVYGNYFCFYGERKEG